MEDSKRLAGFKSLLTDIRDTFKEFKLQVIEDVKITEFDIEKELIQISILQAQYLDILSEESIRLSELKTRQKKLYLERWRYYCGKQTDQYYAMYGVINEKILKTDLDRYLHADEYICLISEICEIQKQKVSYLEDITKGIAGRGWTIKSIIDLRKFESGG